MNFSVLAFVLSASTLYSLPAVADWQYTKWGMSLSELSTLKDKHFYTTTTKEQNSGKFQFGVPLAKTIYMAMGTVFDVNFLFLDDRLTGVVLRMEDLSTAERVLSALDNQYAEPVRSLSKFDAATDCKTIDKSWRDTERQNVVSFYLFNCVNQSVRSSYRVLYRPILNKAMTGL